MKLIKFIIVAVLLLLFAPVAAFAADSVPMAQKTPFPSAMVYSALAGSLVPMVTYVFNHYAPWVSEAAKGLVLALVAAAAGALAQLIDVGGLAFDTNTLSVVGVAVLFAFLAHMGFYTRTGVNVKLGGGTNA